MEKKKIDKLNTSWNNYVFPLMEWNAVQKGRYEVVNDNVLPHHLVNQAY